MMFESRSDLDELLCAEFSRVSDNILHHTADRLWEHREVIEAQLSAKTRDLFSLDEKRILYDLTNRYFESPKRESAIGKYGKSKEKRMDCPLVTLALVVDGHGFPKRSRIFEGNISEPGTLWGILEALDMSRATRGRRRADYGMIAKCQTTISTIRLFLCNRILTR
jgi:transposase